MATCEYVFVCEWVLPETESYEGGLCGSKFTNHSLFTSHIQDHESTFPSASFEECPWNGCQYAPLDKSFYSSHLLFHAYHTFLKLKGGEFQVAKGLPECQMSKDLINTFPESPEARMTCCSSTAKTLWNLTDHTRTHTHEKVTACNGCGLLFSNTTRLRDHLQRQATPSSQSHFCSICKKAFLTERLLKEHIRKHINTIQCPHCAMTCTSDSALLRHITYRHSNSKPFSCPLCRKSFKTKYSLSDHLSTHREKSFSCFSSSCHYTCKSEKLLLQHMKNNHSESTGELYCCHVCDGARFSVGLELTNHLKTVHGFRLPPGHSRFRYVLCDDGLKRLQTVRLDKDDMISSNS
ncbi:PREDICTED: histone H4 transcription factor-like [Amphimedon queenslandica]|uniref:C2H2-type domain-containing protein n=1 Tax=Amphimedon queenslandica TaxID=400682 RepID=A0AAN0IX56_AMPQE|nr:PREDICTED: histone H4 transcription factor-like [Amphimedon queenslandica]|eukprot:XP_019849142.1 PREDICTED: histone H4 transcription factor-like [Amphimedon queenslandica]